MNQELSIPSWPEIRNQTKLVWKAMPPFLRMIMLWCAGWPLSLPLIPILMLIPGTKFTINGKEVSGWEVLRGNELVILSFVTFVILQGVLAYALWSQRSWAREAIAGTLAILAVLATLLGFLDGSSNPRDAVIFFIILLVFVTWYLYFKQNVVAYFEKGNKTGNSPI